MRGIEKPHTSASITATSLPRWASATERLVVTDDLPTPPLPDAMSSTRVAHSGIGERDRAALGVAVGGLAAGGGGRVALELLPDAGALLVGHHAERRGRPLVTPMAGERAGDPALDLVPQRASRHRERDLEGHGIAVDPHVAHHVEVDDGAVQLRVLRPVGGQR